MQNAMCYYTTIGETWEQIHFEGDIIMQDSNSLIMLASLGVMTCALVWMIISIVLTAKGKKKNIRGIILGAILCVGGLYFFASLLLVKAVDYGMEKTDSMVSKFTVDPESKPISGTLMINDSEIKLPCTVGDLKKNGLAASKAWDSEEIYLWPEDKVNGRNGTPCFCAYRQKAPDGEESAEVKDSDVIVALYFPADKEMEFKYSEIKYYIPLDDFQKKYGKAAYNINDTFRGNRSYYLADNDLIIKVTFTPDSRVLNGFMIGASEYMQNDATKITF